MYRRVNSGRFIGLTTFGIVIVMAVFTWVMYGMAQQVFTMTSIMVDLNDNFKSMLVIQERMAADIGAMNVNMTEMNGNISTMSGDITAMKTDVGAMSGSVWMMSDAMRAMSSNLSRMTYDVSQASYAMSNPMSYMWGNSFPF